jgi:hypothetical protein
LRARRSDWYWDNEDWDNGDWEAVGEEPGALAEELVAARR